MANEKENVIKVELPLWVKVIPVLGLGAGLFYAYKKKKSPLGYVGFGLLGGAVGSIIAMPFALKKGVNALGDDLKSKVSAQSAPVTTTPVSNPATTAVTSKREELINKLSKPSTGTVEGGSMSMSFDKSFFKNFTDKELEIMVIMGELEKTSKSEAEAKNIIKQKGITEADLKAIGEKMANAFK